MTEQLNGVDKIVTVGKLLVGTAALLLGACEEAPKPSASHAPAPAPAARPATARPKAIEPAFTGADHIEIIQAGEYLPNSHTPAQDDETSRSWWETVDQKRWLALCLVQGTWQLRPTRVLRTQMEVAGDPEGFEIKSDSCPELKLLLTRDNSSPPRVAPATIEETKPSGSASPTQAWTLRMGTATVQLFFGNEAWLPLWAQNGNWKQEVLSHRAEVEWLEQEGRTPLDYGFASMTHVLWAGDLNGDGHVDLYLKRGDAEVGTTYELFLSGGGATPADLKLADVFDRGGC